MQPSMRTMPVMSPYSAYDSDTCSIARTLALVGDRWTLLVLRDVANGVARFDELAGHLGIARNVLSGRLARLGEGAGGRPPPPVPAEQPRPRPDPGPARLHGLGRPPPGRPRRPARADPARRWLR